MSLFDFKKKEPSAPKTFPYGYELANQPDTKCSNQAIICAFKGFLIFAASFGTIGSVISSFSLPCHLLTIFLILFCFSMGMAFMHYNRIIFNVCYPVLFFVFAYMIFQFRLQVNSGFQAFISIMQRAYSDYYDLSIYREVTEMFSDRTMTITFAAVFIGFFFCILLNIAISEYMSLFLVLLMTFPVLQLGIFIHKQPDMPYLVLLLFAYFSVYLLKRGQHYLMPYRDKKKTEFKYKETKSVVAHRYHASGKIIAQISGLLFVFCLICGVIWLPFSALTQTNPKRTPLRIKADEYMEIFVQTGLSGLFNRYDAKGGLNEGKLGGVSGVRPDYQTDLIVTFVPFSYEPLYLKAYTASHYTGSSFEIDNYDLTALKTDLHGTYDQYESFTSFLESKRFEEYKNAKKNQGICEKMTIENLDANENQIYYPYYTASLNTDFETNRGVIFGNAPVNSKYSLNFYPLMRNYWKINASPDELIQKYGYDDQRSEWILQYDMQSIIHNLDVPDELRAYIEGLKEEIGSSLDTRQQIALIQTYLKDNYTYSMAPGTTPHDADFVYHFLDKQKKGYCSHFAAAATMMLRCYDIPARYVEGYCIPFSAITEADAIDAVYEDWIEGENPLGKTGVISVEVPDANAHAWVEAYLPGIGWVPYEFTPPSDEEEVDNNHSDFWSLFSGLFSQPDAQNQNNTNNQDNNLENSSDRVRFDTLVQESFLRPLILFLVCLSSAFLIWILAKTVRPYQKRQKSYETGDYAPMLSYYYQKIGALYQKKNVTSSILLPTSFAKETLLHLELSAQYSEIYLKNQMELFESMLYGSKMHTKKEADDLLLFFKAYYKQLKSYKCKR